MRAFSLTGEPEIMVCLEKKEATEEGHGSFLGRAAQMYEGPVVYRILTSRRPGKHKIPQHVPPGRSS